MSNPMRNELVISVGGKDILLRPTFENVAAMESKLGGLVYLAWRFSQGGASIKMPGLSECAQIIYFNQAATKPENPSQKLLSLEEVWDLVQVDGLKVIAPITQFLSKITAGNAMANDLSETQKKT